MRAVVMCACAWARRATVRSWRSALARASWRALVAVRGLAGSAGMEGSEEMAERGQRTVKRKAMTMANRGREGEAMVGMAVGRGL